MRSLKAGRYDAIAALVVAVGVAAGTSCKAASDGPSAADGGGAGMGVACLAAWPMPNTPSSGLPNPQAYDARVPGAILDRVTGLLWQQAVDPGSYDWAAANRYCGSLTLAGHHDWRLPSLVELVSIVDLARADPAIDSAAFPATPSLPFWSSQTIAGNSGLAWYVYFKNGGAYAGNDVSDPQRIRCVSGAVPSARAPSCFVSSAATVYDPHTKLTWQRAVDSGSFTSVDAQRYCAALDAAGGGWRLPSLKELMTLVDVTRVDPAIDTGAFPATPSEFFWSSTPSLTPAGAAWGTNFNAGSAGASLAASMGRARCVR